MSSPATSKPAPTWEPNRLYTVQEIAAAYGVSQYTVYAWLRAGKLRPVPPPRREICVEGGVLREFKRRTRGESQRLRWARKAATA